MSDGYSEIEGDPEGVEGKVLDGLSGGMPYAFVVATSIEPLSLRLSSDSDLGTTRALLNRTLRALPGGSDEISDGHHTFRELYDHRRALTAVLAVAAASTNDAWRSKAHHPDDDPMFDGEYFVVGIDLPTGDTITYHYELKYWDDFTGVLEIEHAPRWDGAKPDDTVARLLALARLASGQDETQ